MAHYTVLSETEIHHLLDAYDLGRVLQAAAMKGGQANSSYRVTTEKGTFILTVCDEKTGEDVDCLTAVLCWLNRYNFPTNRPVATREQRFVITHENRPVYIKEYIEGAVVRHLSKNMLFQLGRTLSDLHALPAPDILPATFPYGFETFDELSGCAHPYATWLKEHSAYLQEHIDVDLDRGFIHGDIYWDNLLFSGDSLVAVLDFEEACHYFTLYDLGVCTVGCCTGDDGLDMGKMKELLRGYQQRRPMTGRQKSQLKLFVEYAGVAGSFWRFRQYNIRYPSEQLRDSYRELSSLADQVHSMTPASFLAHCEASPAEFTS